MRQFRYIGSITEEELRVGNVYPCINEDGFRCILVKNSEKKTVLSKYDTDNLSVKLNSVLSFQNEEYFFHIITAKKSDQENNNGFQLVYEYIFGKIVEPISDMELSSLILSLEEYFRITPDPNRRKLQIGVWGELFCIKTLFYEGYPDILTKYHNNFFMKHDVEINQQLRIEIKSSIDQKRIHHFRHDQLYRKDIDVLVASLLLEESQSGYSLYALFNDILNLVSDAEDRFALQKTMKLCGVNDDNHGLAFSEKKAREDMRFFSANDLPKIQMDIPQGVTKVEYDVDCSMSKSISIIDIINRLNHEATITDFK